MLAVASILAGAVMLYFGAEWLVRGSSGLARALGIPAFAIGLTVVAYGTSAPELIVGVMAGLKGSSGIALGNVVGSNIANLGLILGVTSLIQPTEVGPGLGRRELPALIATTAAIPLVLWNGVIGRVEGAALVLAAVIWTWMSLRQARRATPESDARETSVRPKPVLLVVIALGGLVVLLLGGKLLVDGAVSVARQLGWSERLIGLTIVAVGTSLPELATSLIAAIRRQSALAVGNILGSNLFNVLMVLGGTALVGPVRSSPGEIALDLAVLAVLTAASSWMMRRQRTIGRVEGAGLLTVYAAFLAMLAWPAGAP